MAANIIRPEVESFLEGYGFNVSVEEYSNGMGLSLQQYTPAGEDWYVEIGSCENVKDLLDEIERYYESFDVDEETDIWRESAGKNGVPKTSELVKDQEWKDELLKKMSEDKSIAYLSDFPIYISVDLSQTLKEHSFTLDESSAMYQSEKDSEVFVEFLAEDWNGSFYEDIFQRAEFGRQLAVHSGIEGIKTFDDLCSLGDEDTEYKEEEEIQSGEVEDTLPDFNYAESTIDVYVRVYDEPKADGYMATGIYAVLKDGDGDFLAGCTVQLTDAEQKAVYNMVKNCFKDNKHDLDYMLREARMLKAEEKEAAQKEIFDFAALNFYDKEDIIRTYINKEMSLKEVHDFLSEHGVVNATLSDVNGRIDEVLCKMSKEELDRISNEYAQTLYWDNIGGAKQEDDLKRKNKDTIER